MYQNPPRQSQPAGWPAAGIESRKNNNFIHPALPQAQDTGRISTAKL